MHTISCPNWFEELRKDIKAIYLNSCRRLVQPYGMKMTRDGFAWVSGQREKKNGCLSTIGSLTMGMWNWHVNKANIFWRALLVKIKWGWNSRRIQSKTSRCQYFIHLHRLPRCMVICRFQGEQEAVQALYFFQSQIINCKTQPSDLSAEYCAWSKSVSDEAAADKLVPTLLARKIQRNQKWSVKQRGAG